jgi:hypothetical protein
LRAASMHSGSKVSNRQARRLRLRARPSTERRIRRPLRRACAKKSSTWDRYGLRTESGDGAGVHCSVAAFAFVWSARGIPFGAPGALHKVPFIEVTPCGTRGRGASGKWKRHGESFRVAWRGKYGGARRCLSPEQQAGHSSGVGKRFSSENRNTKGQCQRPSKLDLLLVMK